MDLDRRLVLFDGMSRNVPSHEFSEDLRSRTIIRAAGLKELLSKRSLDADAKPCIFLRHAKSVSSGYTYLKGQKGSAVK